SPGHDLNHASPILCAEQPNGVRPAVKPDLADAIGGDMPQLVKLPEELRVEKDHGVGLLVEIDRTGRTIDQQVGAVSLDRVERRERVDALDVGARDDRWLLARA